MPSLTQTYQYTHIYREVQFCPTLFGILAGNYTWNANLLMRFGHHSNQVSDRCLRPSIMGF